MVTHQPKDGHPPEGCILQTRNWQSTYFGPNFRKWSEFGLFPENQSEFGLNLLRKSDFFNFRWPTGPGKGSTDGFLGAPVNFCFVSFLIQTLQHEKTPNLLPKWSDLV